MVFSRLHLFTSFGFSTSHTPPILLPNLAVTYQKQYVTKFTCGCDPLPTGLSPWGVLSFLTLCRLGGSPGHQAQTSAC